MKTLNIVITVFGFKVVNMKNYTCLLADGTVGSIEVNIPEDAFMREGVFHLIGQMITVQLRDQNGIAIEKEGVVVEVLDFNEEGKNADD